MVGVAKRLQPRNGKKTVIAGVANIAQHPQCKLKGFFAIYLTGAG